MIFDPKNRQEKYSTLQEAIVTLGYRAEVMVGEAEPDALAIWTDFGGSNAARPQSRFWMHRRERGWYLGFSGLRRYRIPDQSAALAITLDLARRLQAVPREEALANTVQKFTLTPVEQPIWHLEEREEQRLAWEKYGWRTLHQDEETSVWSQFNSHFLDASGKIHIPKHFLSWGIPDQSSNSVETLRKAEGLLTIAVLDALQHCTSAEQHVIVLDWDHPCYRFFPHNGIRKPYRDYWAVPVWPQMDSYYFVAPNFEFGILANRSGQIHFYGQALIDASYAVLTELLGPPIA